MDPVQDQLPPMVVASRIYRGPGPLPKCLGEKGSHNGQFEGGQLVQAILTKGGLRLPKVLVVMPSWAPWSPLSCRPSGLGLVAPIWKTLPDASGLLACVCPLCTKEETRTLRLLAPTSRLPGLDRHGLRHGNLARFSFP